MFGLGVLGSPANACALGQYGGLGVTYGRFVPCYVYGGLPAPVTIKLRGVHGWALFVWMLLVCSCRASSQRVWCIGPLRAQQVFVDKAAGTQRAYSCTLLCAWIDVCDLT